MLRFRIIGVGIDLVEIAGIVRIISESDGGFLSRYFTEAELAFAGQSARRAPRLAGRFAAKEAVVKALGIGWGDGIAWTDIEVLTSPSGAPSVILYNVAATAAVDVSRWFVSISCAGGYATAVAVAVGERPGCGDQVRS
ncbi:MAG: holo-ACP synthase [Hyphomicrobiaceae bacterium]|nr:holo-ACP synthase [Hyphomicrobiaceae bacterium]